MYVILILTATMHSVLAFFRNLEFPAEYVLLLSAESKYFVHYIRMASAKLKSDLEMHS